MKLQSAVGFSDQELSLISGNQSKKSLISPAAYCSLVKLLPFLSYFILSLLHVEDSVVAVITLILVFIEFVFIKYVSGINLVGLKWSIDFSSLSFQWYSKPEPFIPSISDTNFFWMSFFTFLIIWLICFFIAFYSSTKIKAITSLISFICEGVNLYMFSKAHNCAKKQVEKAVLNSIQEEVHFDLVPENDYENDDKETINDNKESQEVANESYFLPKKTSKISDTTSVPLPPPLMPTKPSSEDKEKNSLDIEQNISNSENENTLNSNVNDNENNNNINDNRDDKEDNENKDVIDDDVDFY